jgi:hypothetical protein
LYKRPDPRIDQADQYDEKTEDHCSESPGIFTQKAVRSAICRILRVVKDLYLLAGFIGRRITAYECIE